MPFERSQFQIDVCCSMAMRPVLKHINSQGVLVQYIGYRTASIADGIFAELASLPKLRVLDVMMDEDHSYWNGSGHVLSFWEREKGKARMCLVSPSIPFLASSMTPPT